ESQRRGADGLSPRAGRGAALPGSHPGRSRDGAQWLAPGRDERGSPPVCVGRALLHRGGCPPVRTLALSRVVLWAQSRREPSLGVWESCGRVSGGGPGGGLGRCGAEYLRGWWQQWRRGTVGSVAKLSFGGKI